MDHGVMLGLAGKRAVVTGGSRGVGRATALLLSRCGADVGVAYRTRQSEAESVAAEVRGNGVRSFAYGADLASAAGAKGLFDTAERELGGVDIFVGNAGIWPPESVPLAEMTEEQWTRTIDANLTSIFHTIRLAAARVTDGGSIVLVSSTAGQRGEAFHADYAASKGAIISLTKGVAVELAPRDVNVNCVAPGWIDTEMISDVVATRGREEIADTIPLGRIATADDVAGPIIFLCSNLARHITGEIVNINGGSVLCG